MSISIPCYKYTTKSWDEAKFGDISELVKFIGGLFKEPGQYNFTAETEIFRTEALKFETYGVYSTAPFMSKEFVEYWDDQKYKCRNGIIVEGVNDTWFLTRDYYMWLNFLPIYNKEIKKYGFARVRDAQYHMALYEWLAEHSNAHAAILKKRQIASSYFHAAKLINTYWFEEGSVLKMGASLKSYVNDEGTWKFLDEYKNFLNEHTAWYRPANPDKTLLWEQKIEVVINGRKTNKGLMSKIQGMSFEKNPTKGVGGPVTYFFHEEAGIAPKMDQTYEYLRPAMSSGQLNTGMFIAAGSVGDLDQCEPLKQMVLNPKANGIYAVETNLLDENGGRGEVGLFIPEQWSMPPFIDDYGNSLVEEALVAIQEERAIWKRDLSPEQYQLRISQKPTNIAEAFAYRKESLFPQNLISSQTKRIEEKSYPVEYIELDWDDKGTGLIPRRSNKQPINSFPVDKRQEDKTGVLCVYERPVDNPAFGQYYASIDPVGEGKTTTSESLCSIYVYKNPVEVTKVTDEGPKSYVEGDMIVAAWCGRYDDINKTHEQLEKIIEWYKAWTLVENNVSLFIQYMIAKRKQKWLVPKDQVLFLKDIGSNRSVYAEYGWKNTGTLFKNHMINYAIEFLKEEIDVETDADGTITKRTFGIERIPDIMLMKEMHAYQPGVNVDRLVSFAALIAFAKVQQANRGYAKRIDNESSVKLDNTQKMTKLNMSPFRHVGKSSKGFMGGKGSRSAFKNLK
jgi:hypothetical protein